MKTIYYISGLGADERVFKFLQLKDVNEKFIRWIQPHNHEALSDYCKRLTSQIDPDDDIVLVGISFGGIVAQEISKHISADKVIIISSIKSPLEMDWKLTVARYLKLHLVAPSRFLKWANLLTADYYFGTQSKAESKLLKQIIKDTDRSFMRWAINEIMRWENSSPRQKIFHVHGSNDRIFPMGRIKNAVVVEGGGHFMIVSRAKEVSEILQRQITL
jgi:pimeloyl-ACP methyl ester carboxylesterase